MSSKKTSFEAEIDNNGVAFSKRWTKEISDNISVLAGHDAFARSYRRLTALQAIKANLIKKYSSGSAEFFFEAHNDAMTSHVCASFGAWRTSLQALRGAIENTLCAVYFKDHPVELERWEKGHFRIGFQELSNYCESHPRIGQYENKLKIIESIRSEYATLSKAVHSSAKNFRMTDAAGKILIWSTEKAKVGMWSTRHSHVVQDIALLMSIVEAPQLLGTMNPNVRASMFFAISASKRTAIKDVLGITIPNPQH
jgi:hypothetical protein